VIRARRLVSPAPHELVVEKHELPDRPPPGGILARAATTAVSAGTEIANYEGRTAQRGPESTQPYYPGYSFAGAVLAAGEGAPFAPGERVCGPLPHASHVIEARPERLARLTKIPDQVGSEQAALTQLGCIVLNAVRMARIELGERVAVVGAGLVGLLAIRLAQLSGGRPVAALDLLASRVELARGYGAHAGSDPDELAPLAPGGFDVVFEATGAPAAVTSAFRLAARGGRVVLLGSTRGLVTDFDPYGDVHLRGITVLGAHVSTTPFAPTLRDPWTETANRRVLLDLMREGTLDVTPLITHRIGPDEAPAAFAALAAKADGHLGVVIDWS
jgi:2-desacetyl-2-hydroxyethyl bacteriochlorophyllide A dehydrogenase